MTFTTEQQDQYLSNLDNEINQLWSDFLSSNEIAPFIQQFLSKDLRPYALYLTQVYHYAYHTARNQAMVGVNPNNTNLKYMKFCFEHALEETGHEMMARHDLRAMGIDVEDVANMPPPMMATELTVAYLYWVSSNGNPVQRLGYSFWAERSYGIIGSIVETMSEQLKLREQDMTFYFSHADIDDKHAKDVENILRIVCKHDDDWQAVRKTAITTVQLTQDIFRQVIAEYQKLIANEDSDYAIINTIRTHTAAA